MNRWLSPSAFIILRLLVAGGAPAQVKPEIFVQTGHGFGLHAVAYSPDGKSLLAPGAARSYSSR